MVGCVLTTILTLTSTLAHMSLLPRISVLTYEERP